MITGVKWISKEEAKELWPVTPLQPPDHYQIYSSIGGVHTLQRELNRRQSEGLFHILNHPVKGRRYRRGKHRCKACGGLISMGD